MNKPKPGHYSEYFGGYIQQVTRDLYVEFERGYAKWHGYFSRITEADSLKSYAEGKWNIRQLLQHITDTEQVMAYRALRIARGDKTPLPGFSQDQFADNDFTGEKTWEEVIAAYQSQRPATINLMQSFPESVWNNVGTVSKAEMSVSALCYLIVGHEIHHLNVFEERYLPLLN